MNQHLKQIFYSTLFIISTACLITACSKTPIRPNTHTTSTKTNDSTLAVDTLPSFNSPTGVAVDAAGNIYVADYGNNLIRKITPAGVVSTLAGTGNQGSIDATGSLASFNAPTSITADASGNLYVADAGNNLIRKITQTGMVSTFAGSDTTGSANGTGIKAAFFGPAGIAADVHGNVYVADAGNNMIRMITSTGTVTTLASNGNAGANGGSLTVSSFNNPTGVVVDAGGNVFVANYLNNNILEINPAGAISTFAGTGSTGANNGPGTSATFYFPNSVAVDAANNIYVADGVNNLIRKIDPTGMVSTLAGSGMQGAIDSTGTAASFNGPSGLAVDASGNVYVADSNNNLIRKITPTGVVTTIAGNGEAGAKNGVAFAYRNKKTLKFTSKKKLDLIFRPKSR